MSDAGVACDADLEAWRLCRYAVYIPVTEMSSPRTDIAVVFERAFALMDRLDERTAERLEPTPYGRSPCTPARPPTQLSSRPEAG